jgi:hypothetical protein
VICDFPVNACFTVAIPLLRNLGLPLFAGNPLILLLCIQQGCRADQVGHRGSNPDVHWPQAKKIDRQAVTLNSSTKRQCLAAAGGLTQPHSKLAPQMRARSLYFALDFFV